MVTIIIPTSEAVICNTENAVLCACIIMRSGPVQNYSILGFSIYDFFPLGQRDILMGVPEDIVRKLLLSFN